MDNQADFRMEGAGLMAKTPEANEFTEVVKHAREACNCWQCQLVNKDEFVEARLGRPCVADSLIQAWGRERAASRLAGAIDSFTRIFDTENK